MKSEAKSLEKVNINAIQKKIRSKKTSYVEQYISKDVKSDGLEYKIFHPIPIFRNWFPIFYKNISIKIAHQ